MYKGKGLWLCIVATLMLTTVGIAQDKDRNPDEKQLDRAPIPRAVQDRMEILVRGTVAPLVQRVSKSVVQRYNLDQTAVSEFHQSIQESAEALLKQPGDLLALTAAARSSNNDKMLETLLSQPDCKAAFVKYLNEEQFQDYTEFTRARRQRDWGAVARHLTAWLDQQLSLTVDQREKIEQRLIANADRGRLAGAGDMLWNRLPPETVVRQGFKYPPDDVLSQTQLVIWTQLVVSPKFNVRGQIPEHARKEIVARIIENLKADKIAHEGGEVVIELRDKDKIKALIDWSEDKDAASESQKKMRRIAKAKIAAHTEQLGPLDESASQRLTLATKGVVEEYLDAQGKDWNSKYEEVAKEIHEAVATGKMTNQEAAQKLEGLKKRVQAEERATNSYTDITNHPLYQQAIKDVLPEEGFTQYEARQAERQDFRQQALRDVLVASIDTQLFLSDKQRKHFEMAAEELLAVSMPDEVPAPVYTAYQLCQRTDRELLSPWQREEFKRIHMELETRVKFGEKR